jgi:hypothetical protein
VRRRFDGQFALREAAIAEACHLCGAQGARERGSIIAMTPKLHNIATFSLTKLMPCWNHRCCVT